MKNENKGMIIGRPQIEKATETLQKYKRGKVNLENKVIENEQWWKLRHWEYIRKKDESGIKPASAWLFNSIANKHADAMDNYPEPNVLARALDDEDTAKRLSTILPVVLEQNNYEDVYSHFIGGGTPYYITQIEDTWYLTEHRIPGHSIWSFKVKDNEITSVTTIY